jgi:hypothetical protein
MKKVKRILKSSMSFIKSHMYDEVEYRIEHFTEGIAKWCETNVYKYSEIGKKINAQQLYNTAIKYARKML